MARTANAYITIHGKDNVSRTIKNVNKGLGGLKASTIAVGTAMGNALSGIASRAISGLTDTIGQSINAARDLNETISKTNVVFGDSAKSIEEFAATAAVSFGQSKQQAMDAAAGFAVFGQSAGLTGEGLVDFSTDLTALASDMASFSNTSVDEAIVAISSGLRGESLPLRRYGVLLDEATLRARALEMGLVNTTKKALTPQQKVLAAQAEILAQTSLQQGDFARTSDGLANKQRQLTASLENTKSALGQALLPIALDVTNAFMGFLPTLQDLIGPLTSIAGKIVKDVVPGIKAFLGSLGKDKALKETGRFLQKDLFPALSKLATFVFNDVIPAVLEFGTKLGNGLMPIIKTVAGFIGGTLVPIFLNIVGAVSKHVLPTLGKLANIFITRVLPIISAVVAFIAAELAPVFARIGTILSEKVIPTIGKLVTFFTENVLPTLIDVVEFLWGNGNGPFAQALKFIGGAINIVVGAVEWLVTTLSSLLDILMDVAKAIADSPIGQVVGAVGGFVGDLFGGERAQGGPVAGGRAYLVGEKGPELFVPGQSGSVIPNSGLAMPAVSAGAAGGVAGEIRRAFAGLGIYLDGESVGRVSDRRLSVALATTGTTSRSAGAFRYGR